MDENEEKDLSENSQDGSVEDDESGEDEPKINSDKVPEKNVESEANSPEDNSNRIKKKVKETANDLIAKSKNLESEDKLDDLDMNSEGSKLKVSEKKNPRRSSDENNGEKASNGKPDCQHLSKDFKIVKKRYHCPDCNGIVCPECLTVVPTTLARHLQNADSKEYKIHACKLCDLFFLSKCALQAHDRIHMLDTPHVCPDCGSIFKTIYYLTLHLINKCYHVYKSMRFRCSVCLSAYKTAEVFCDHIRNVHIKLMVKCSECDSLFNDIKQVQRHATKLHKDKQKQVKTKLFIRCSLCVSSAMPKHQEAEHVKYHRDHSVTHQFIYLCPCGQPYNSVTGFKLHTDNCKKKGVLPPQWNYLQTKMKAQELRLRDDTARPESPESNFCLKCGDELNGTANCIKCVNDDDYSPLSINETESKNAEKSESLEVSQDNDVCVISLKDNNRNEVNKNMADEDKLKKQSKYFYYNFKKAFQNQDTSMDDDVIIIEDKSKKNDDSCKIKYGHVPNDHLGYLKAYEQNNLKDPALPDDKNMGYYRTEMILDEETGLMKPTQVWVDRKDSYKRLPIQTDKNQQNFHPLDSTMTDLRKKYKDAFFSCPFCSTLFFKHESSFQKFLLHVECYHPDSGIDITVDKTELPKPKKPFYSLRAQFESDPDDDSEADDVDLQTRLRKNSNKPMRFKPMVVYEDDIGKITNSVKKPVDIDNLHVKSKKDEDVTSLDSKKKKKITYVKITTPIFKRKKEFFDKEEKSKAEVNFSQGVTITRNKNRGNEPPDVEIRTVNGLKSVQLSEKTARGKSNETSPVIDETKDNPELNKSVNEDSNLSSRKDSDSEEVKLNESNESSHHKEDVSCDSASNLSFRSLRKKAKDEDGMPRKEREVWEEFYQSLKIAEKKVKKIKEQDQSDNSEKPVIADYSSKRVVKKPKRYLESSGSESEEESPEDDKSPLDTNENSKDEVINTAENSETADSGQHRTVDQKFVDYLFNFIEKKDKKTDLFKKHSTIRMNRGNIRDYRTDVLNGIKNRGRPRKYFNFKNSIPSKNQKSQESFLKSSKEEIKPTTPEPVKPVTPEPRESPKTTTPLKEQPKIEMKKRGRPKKHVAEKPAIVKERRLSDFDKEVNFIEKNFETNDTDSSSNKRKRKLSSKLLYYKKISKSEKDDFSSGQVITNKQEQTDKKLTCAICKETHSSVTEFREHIVSHRMDENTHQCMECGECFVVRPSLAKHLHAFHKIKDIDKYIAENDCGAVEKKVVEEEPVVEDLKENQCKVCKDQFDCAGDLNKHFRIHGMAFLKEFKRDNKASC